MTDEEIKKTLECCLAPKHDCSYCLLENEVHCTSLLHKNILALINRQQAEIERLQKESNEQFDKIKLLDDRTKQRYAELFEEAKEFVRTEAIKEFAERLKEMAEHGWIISGVQDYAVSLDNIDNLVQKMVGGENA